MKSIIVLAVVALTLSSCVSVQEYDKVNLSDPEMELAAKKVERFETNFQLYREGSSGANGGKTGGGCGCN